MPRSRSAPSVTSKSVPFSVKRRFRPANSNCPKGSCSSRGMTFVTYENAGGFLAPEWSGSGLSESSSEQSHRGRATPPLARAGTRSAGTRSAGTRKRNAHGLLREGELHVTGFPSRNVIV